MAIDKEHLEFHTLDMASGWETPPGYPSGIKQKLLAGNLNEENKTGGRSRLLRIEPGVYTAAPENFKPPTYACRPPHTDHGPSKSVSGCVMFEIHYYDPA